MQAITGTGMSTAARSIYSNANRNIESAGSGDVGSAKQALLSKDDNLTLGDGNMFAGIVDFEAQDLQKQTDIQAGQKIVGEKALSRDEFINEYTGEKTSISS